MKMIAIPALLALALAAPAVAAPAVTTTIAVSPAGLDLSTSDGAATMAGRIDRAALRACGASGFSARDVQTDVRRSVCYQQAIGQAETALNAPAVTAALRTAAADH